MITTEELARIRAIAEADKNGADGKAWDEWLAERCADELCDSCPYLELYQDTGCRPDYCVCSDTAEDGFDCTELPKKCWLKESATRPWRKGNE